MHRLITRIEANLYTILLVSLLFTFTSASGRAKIEDILQSPNTKDTAEINFNINFAKKYYDTENPNYDSALLYLNRALKISEQNLNEPYIYKIYNTFAVLLYRTENYPLAAEYYFKMLNMLDEKTIKESDSETRYEYINLYRNIGICISRIDMEKAGEYTQKSLDMLEELKKTDPGYPHINKMLYLLYTDIGAAWLSMGDFEKSNSYFEGAMQYSAEIENPMSPASLYNNLGTIKLELGQYDEAFEFYQRALDIYKELKYKSGIAGIYYNFGSCHYHQHNNAKAIEDLTYALGMAQEEKNIQIQMLCAETLGKIYKEQQNFSRANEMVNLYYLLRDSLSGNDKINNLARIEFQYMFQKQMKENEYQQQIIIAEREQKILAMLLLALLFFSLLVFAILLYLNLRVKNKKNILQKENLALQNENLALKNEQLEQTLEEKNNELNSHMKYLLKKKEFVASVIENVSEIKEQDPKQMVSAMKDIKSDIESSVWNEFNVLFQNLHQDFYTSLYQKHPELTPNEMRLCAFIRLNMSTKEIANLTLQTIKSVEVARTRLRKKLQITREVNLSFYLSQF